MGIQGLTKLIADNAPEAIKENLMTNYFGRKIAVDASMALYQFLIAVRPDETGSYTLTNDVGEETSHLMGMFYRTIRMLDNGIKPVFVFDGKPPTLKSGELAKRGKKRKEAEEAKAEAKETGDAETLAKMNKRTVRVTQKHNEEAKKLLRLMGVPVVEAPCEAEAQCSALVRANKCYGVASEDMDSLTLGTTLLLRHMTYSEARKMPIREIRLQKVLEGLGISMDSFVDLCILLGCDYCDTIKGIGPKRALEQIKKYKSIDAILDHLDKEKYPVPETFPFQEIRQLFKNPEVADPEKLELKWTDPQEEALLEFLVKEKAFSEDRVRKGIEKLKKNKSTTVQGRITSFFAQPTPAPKAPASQAKSSPKKSNSKASLTETKEEPTTSTSTTPSTTAASVAETKEEPKEEWNPFKVDPMETDDQEKKAGGIGNFFSVIKKAPASPTKASTATAAASPKKSATTSTTTKETPKEKADDEEVEVTKPKDEEKKAKGRAKSPKKAKDEPKEEKKSKPAAKKKQAPTEKTKGKSGKDNEDKKDAKDDKKSSSPTKKRKKPESDVPDDPIEVDDPMDTEPSPVPAPKRRKSRAIEESDD